MRNVGHWLCFVPGESVKEHRRECDALCSRGRIMSRVEHRREEERRARTSGGEAAELMCARARILSRVLREIQKEQHVERATYVRLMSEICLGWCVTFRAVTERSATET